MSSGAAPPPRTRSKRARTADASRGESGGAFSGQHHYEFRSRLQWASADWHEWILTRLEEERRQVRARDIRTSHDRSSRSVERPDPSRGELQCCCQSPRAAWHLILAGRRNVVRCLNGTPGYLLLVQQGEVSVSYRAGLGPDVIERNLGRGAHWFPERILQTQCTTAS
ncbi:hypothetical protein BV25DRAFT_1425560 [Artomyces pyxidatus]|uniref:Uncharacterized protein n=1 Tax=Artomyces pyxidatus TaxID=48021 RepID=A0ACB8SNW0_9AGAM|nr:hypothetical protein BV25DRAFT_1425560 [Artomyces pyxidatus]